MDLATEIYRITKDFPSDEKYGLTAQMRRAAVSVPANIAEGYGRQSDKAFAAFVKIAKGSLNELETMVHLSERLGLIPDPKRIFYEINGIGARLSNLIKRLEPQLVREELSEYNTQL